MPTAWLDGCRAAHRRLDALLGALTDDQVSAPTALEGWTLGHLLTHLARNADALVGVTRAAGRGEYVQMYPGGPAQRDGDIKAGATRPMADLVADLRRSVGELESAWEDTTSETWATGLGGRKQGPTTIADFVALRWREVEVHLPDLHLPGPEAPSWETLSPAYVDEEWRRLLPGLGTRLPREVTVVLVPGDRPSTAHGSGPETVVLRERSGAIMRWLFGRGAPDSWPALGPW
jgi:maleylpyruvate isomerase